MAEDPNLPLHAKFRLLEQGMSATTNALEKKADTRIQEFNRPSETVKHPDEANFGDLQFHQSAYKTQRNWVKLGDLSANVGRDVWVRARVHNVRAKGKTCFIVLRRGFDTVQAAMFVVPDVEYSADMVKYAGKIPNESVVDIFGTVSQAQLKSDALSVKNAEISVKKIFVVSASVPVLPFQLDDASNPEPKGEVKEGEATPTVALKTRLDNRWLDTRTLANHAIFRIQSSVCRYFRDYFLARDFVEIHSPKITPGVSEGGADVFKFKYFGKWACLAQSPQLYKQMAVISDLFKVFEIGPVFRAENSNTNRHMCEFVGMDFEMEIKEHYHELLEVLGDLFVYIFDHLNEHCKKELEAVRKQWPFENLVYKRKTPVIPFKEAIQMLREGGMPDIEELEDISTPAEKLLGRLMKKKHGVDFYIVDQYPRNARPFYTMISAESEDYTNSYDVFLRGEEITSGAQRIHHIPLLKKRAEECGIPLSNIDKYLESFQYGAYPHGGAGIGLERVVMLFMGLGDIRMSSLFPRDPKRLAP